jgi:hypothetical protein
MRKHLPLILYLLSGASLLAGVVLASVTVAGGMRYGENFIGFALEAEHEWQLIATAALILFGAFGLAAAWWLSNRQD